MNIAFLSNKKIYSDPKNEDIVKILRYFVVFLNLFFNIIKLGEPKFTISHTKSILIFSLLEAARALHVQPMLVYKKMAMSLQCFGTVHPTYFTIQYCSCNNNFVSLFFLTLCLSFAQQLRCQAALQLQQLHFFSLPFVFFTIPLQYFGTVHPMYFTVQYCSCNSSFVSLFSF